MSSGKPPLQSSTQTLVVEDLDFPDATAHPTHPLPQVSTETGTRKVIVEDIPAEIDPFLLKLYLQSLSQPVQCVDIDIRDGGKAVATFGAAVGKLLSLFASTHITRSE